MAGLEKFMVEPQKSLQKIKKTHDSFRVLGFLKEFVNIVAVPGWLDKGDPSNKGVSEPLNQKMGTGIGHN